jgi:hypothetical protein
VPDDHTDDDAATLARTWEQFCDLLREAGQVVARSGTPDAALDRAEAYRMLTRLTRAGLENFLEHRAPRHPRLVTTCHDTMKIVGDNPDTLYLGASIDGRLRYRLHGDRGSARWISINTFEHGSFGSGGTGVGRTFYAEDLAVARNGAIDLAIGPEPPEGGDWLPTSEHTRSLVIRQTFADRATERPAVLTLTCIDSSGPPEPLSTDDVVLGLVSAGHYVREVSALAARWAEANAVTPNRFVDVEAGFAEAKAFADQQIQYHQAYLDLGPDEAASVTVVPPTCPYWMFVLHNHWMESLDYRHHRVHCNNRTATLEPDGSLRLVVAHRDPGMANWLDTAGHRHTILGVRWVGPGVPTVVPDVAVVPHHEVDRTRPPATGAPTGASRHR